MIRAVFFDLDGTLVDRRQSLENYISDFHNISTYRQKLTNKKEAVSRYIVKIADIIF